MRWSLEVQIVLVLFHSCSLSALSFAHLPFLKDDGRKDPLSLLKANCHCHLFFLLHFLPFAVNIEQSNKIILLPVLLEPLSITPHHPICQNQAQNICDKDLCVQKYNHTNPQLCICTKYNHTNPQLCICTKKQSHKSPKIYLHNNTIT